MPTPALAIHGLSFRYPGAAGPLLEIETFKLAAGERALMTGRSGSGKSTLLHLASGLIDLEPPSTGEILVAGQPIQRLRGPARDRFRGAHIGLVFQEHHLLQGFTARENVMAALAFSDVPPREHAGVADELLDRLDVRDRAHATPDRLSLGQQQRVAVARALATSPELVLADEPTASLDPENARAAVELLQSACEERKAALLVVSHDPTLPALFDRVIDLSAVTTEALS